MVEGVDGRVALFSGRAARRLGVTQIVLGCLCVCAQIALLAVYKLDYTVRFLSNCQGIWCGIAFIIVGVFGIVAGKLRRKPWIIVYLVLCIVVCFFTAALISLSALMSAYNYGPLYLYKLRHCSHHHHHDRQFGDATSKPSSVDYWSGYYDTGYYGTGYYGTGYYDTGYYGGSEDYWSSYYPDRRSSSHCSGYYAINVPWVVQFSMNLLMILLGLISAVVAIVSATLSCAPFCCIPLPDTEGQSLTGQDNEGSELDTAQASSLPNKTPPSFFHSAANDSAAPQQAAVDMECTPPMAPYTSTALAAPEYVQLDVPTTVEHV